jgi:hypothetical protein
MNGQESEHLEGWAMSSKKFAHGLVVLGMLLSFGIWTEMSANEKPLAGPTKTTKGYTVYQSVRLDPAKTGVKGFLQVLQDERVTPEYRDKWGNTNAPDMILGKNEPLLLSIKQHPLKNGRLRLISPEGRAIAEEPFEVPLARIETAFLYGTKFPTYLVEADYGIGMGPYAGPATMFLEIRKGKLHYIRAVGEKNRLSLGYSLQNAWKLVPAKNGAGQEIEFIQCHPNWKKPKSDEFVVVYATYRFDGKSWHRKSRQEVGYFDSGESDWPARIAFP